MDRGRRGIKKLLHFPNQEEGLRPLGWRSRGREVVWELAVEMQVSNQLSVPRHLSLHVTALRCRWKVGWIDRFLGPTSGTPLLLLAPCSLILQPKC